MNTFITIGVSTLQYTLYLPAKITLAFRIGIQLEIKHVNFDGQRNCDTTPKLDRK